VTSLFFPILVGHSEFGWIRFVQMAIRLWQIKLVAVQLNYFRGMKTFLAFASLSGYLGFPSMINGG